MCIPYPTYNFYCSLLWPDIKICVPVISYFSVRQLEFFTLSFCSWRRWPVAIAATPSLQWTMQHLQTKFHKEKVTLVIQTHFIAYFQVYLIIYFLCKKYWNFQQIKNDISDNPFLLDPVMQRLVIATQLGRTSVKQNSCLWNLKNDIIILPILIHFAPRINKKSKIQSHSPSILRVEANTSDFFVCAVYREK